MTWKNAHGVSMKVIIKSMWDVRWYILWKNCILFFLRFCLPENIQPQVIIIRNRFDHHRVVHRKPYGAYFLIRRITQVFFFHLFWLHQKFHLIGSRIRCNTTSSFCARTWRWKKWTLPFISENYNSQSFSARASLARWLIRILIQCFSMYKTSVRTRMNVFLIERKKFNFISQ